MISSLKIALTGGVACGKSQVGQILQNLGADVISLDTISRQVVEPGTDALAALVKRFGAEILDANQGLDRQALRDLLLASDRNKADIEAILHPEIIRQMRIQMTQSSNALIVVEVPLLAEKNLVGEFDRVIVVACSRDSQLARLSARDGVDKAAAQQLIDAQFSPEQRLKVAQQLPVDVINNDGDLTQLTQQVEALHQQLINL